MVRGLSGVPDEHYLWDFGWGLQGYGHSRMKHFGSCVMLCAAISNADDNPLAPFTGTGPPRNSSSADRRAAASPFRNGGDAALEGGRDSSAAAQVR